MNPLYALSHSALFKEVKSSPEGLSTTEVQKRLATFGYNRIEKKGGKGPLKIFLSQFLNLMVFILLAGAGISAFLGDTIDTIAITLVVLLNAVIGFLQEYKAEKAIEALKKMTAASALALRDGRLQKIPAEELVPGDIVVLEEGTQVPADGQLLEVEALKAIESSLTGESNAVEKTVTLAKKPESLGDLSHLAFMGTVVSQGHGKMMVLHTGMKTEFGQIAQMVQNQSDDETPLQKKMNQLVKGLSILILFVIAVVFTVAVYQGKDLSEVLLLCISLVVSVIPEGLPTVITLTLALGVQRLAKEKAVVRRLSAAETLGSTDTICTDKTGTLTQNQMTAEYLYVNGAWKNIQGKGYSPEERFDPESEEESLLLEISALCNNATLFQNKDHWDITGDPTEGALLTLAEKGGIDRSNLEKKHPRKGELVFDSFRKRMSTVHGSVIGGGQRLLTKGAPDSVLEVSTHILENGEEVPLTPKKRQAILKQIELKSSDAYRLLGMAYGTILEEDRVLGGEKTREEKNLVFVGMVALMDPPREEAKAAIAICKEAQIKVIMITGDHALTAAAIGKKLGLETKHVLTGSELETMSDHELSKALKDTFIFARVSPKHKVRILEILQKKGHVVAMTGDGVNDAPALKKADIGIAMGITGTDVSKEASDMVLMDDNFSTIVSSVRRGRIIYANIKKFVRFVLSANFGEITVVSVVFLMGGPLPFVPLQILWVNLLTDTLPALALGVDEGEADLMKKAPRKQNESILKDLIGVGLLAGLICAGVCLSLYLFYEKTSSLAHLRTVLLCSIVIFEMFLVFSVRSETKHYFHRFLSNPYLLLGVGSSLLLQIMAVYLTPLQNLLKTAPLSGQDWIRIGLSCALGILILEIWKLVKVRFYAATR